jgi:hypothetical protein
MMERLHEAVLGMSSKQAVIEQQMRRFNGFRSHLRAQAMYESIVVDVLIRKCRIILKWRKRHQGFIVHHLAPRDHHLGHQRLSIRAGSTWLTREIADCD